MEKEEELMKLIHISKKLNKTSKIIVIGFIFFILSYILNYLLLFLWAFGYIFNVLIYSITTIIWVYGLIYVFSLLIKVLIISRVVESGNLKKFIFLYSISLFIFQLTFNSSYIELWKQFFVVFPAIEDFFYSPITINGIWTLFKLQFFILVIGLVISGVIQFISWNYINKFLLDFPDNDVIARNKDRIKRNKIYTIMSMIPILNIMIIPYIIKSMRVFNNPNEWNVDTRLMKQQENSNVIPTKCPKCGAVIPNNAEFCSECGNKINKA